MKPAALIQLFLQGNILLAACHLAIGYSPLKKGILSQLSCGKFFNNRSKLLNCEKVSRESFTLTQPISPLDFMNSRLDSRIYNTAKLLSLAVAGNALTSTAVKAEESDDNNVQYSDKERGYYISIPSAGWSVIRRTTPTSKLARYQSEEVILTGTCFAEGASLSITRSNAPQLLQDFNIEWWFAPISTITDVGTPPLIAELLILQRQGEFEKKRTASEIKNVELNPTDSGVYFEFLTPIVEGVYRKTLAKTLLRGSTLYTVWISGLETIFDADYGKTLISTRDSFRLAPMKIR